ncbi:hypothetical protein GCM10022267_91060 [Lentzea roselyniae]|uniref:Terpene synthase n=1 Tax=Lentzea roselyniae TaxID=531940 RepID=A0ABP7CGV4_9PSEU
MATNAASQGVPGIYCPVPATCPSSGSDLDRAALDWLRQFNVCDEAWLDSMEQARPLQLLAAACPAGITDRLRMVGDLWMWAFAFDDAFFDGGVLTGDPGGACIMLRPLMRVLEAPYERSEEATGWEAALRDVRMRLEECGSPTQLNRWAAAARDMLFSFACEAAVVQQSRGLGLREYLTHRMDSSGAKHHLLLVDFTYGYELSTDSLADHVVRAATEACCVLLGMDNDLFSYDRERAVEADATLNSIDIVATEFGLSPEEALTKTLDIRNRIMTDFLDSTALIRQRGDANLAHYAQNLAQWVRANIDWSRTTRRYREHIPRDGRSLAVPDIQVGGRFAADPRRPVVWWWERLA